MPLALMTLCQGTLSWLYRASGSTGRCLRHTPTCRGLCAIHVNANSAFIVSLPVLPSWTLLVSCARRQTRTKAGSTCTDKQITQGAIAKTKRQQKQGEKKKRKRLTRPDQPRNMSIARHLAVRNLLHSRVHGVEEGRRLVGAGHAC